jgi:hypothetical protein
MMISSFKNHQTIFVCLDSLDVLNVAIFFLSTNEIISLQNKRKGRGEGREKRSHHMGGMLHECADGLVKI